MLSSGRRFLARYNKTHATSDWHGHSTFLLSIVLHKAQAQQTDSARGFLTNTTHCNCIIQPPKTKKLQDSREASPSLPAKTALSTHQVHAQHLLLLAPPIRGTAALHLTAQPHPSTAQHSTKTVQPPHASHNGASTNHQGLAGVEAM